MRWLIEKRLSQPMRWLIEKLLTLYYRKTGFLSLSFPVDDHTDIIISTEEWTHDNRTEDV